MIGVRLIIKNGKQGHKWRNRAALPEKKAEFSFNVDAHDMSDFCFFVD